MTEKIDLQEFVGGFIAEADEIIGAATGQLLEIEAGIAENTLRPKAVRDLFRGLHTLKGLAGMIGVEPIVEIAHELETLLRAADKGGGHLRRAGVEVAVQGVRAIAERVRAVSDNRPVAPAPEALLEAIAATDISSDNAPIPPAPVAPMWEGRLGPSEQQQLAAAVHARTPVWTITFVPGEALAASGVTIATVRADLAKLGDLVKVAPRHADGGVVFDLLFTSKADLAAIAAAAHTAPAHVVSLSAPAASEAPLPPPPPPSSPVPEADEPTALHRSVIRVELGRLDDIQDLLSNLVVSRFRLEREIATLHDRGVDVRRLREIGELQARQLRDLRRAILRARLVRVAEVLEPLALVVRSLTRPGQKEVRLVIDVGGAEIDKGVADRLFPAIVHLVRNAVDHAIEAPDDRVAAGKPRAGLIRITCADAGSRLELAITDDGRGIDRDAVARRAGHAIADTAALLDVITTPGFSTRDVASQTSGRGLGMDIVRRTVVRDLGGELELDTAVGTGTTFRMRVPLTIAIVDVFSFSCGDQSFVAPVAVVDEIFELADAPSRPLPARADTRTPISLVQRRGQPVALVSLGALLAVDTGAHAKKALVVRRGADLLAFSVDRMLGRQEVVVRPIDDPLARMPGIAGATDLGDGRPTLVLDLIALGAQITRRPAAGGAA